jgi:hypothetical protein
MSESPKILQPESKEAEEDPVGMETEDVPERVFESTSKSQVELDTPQEPEAISASTGGIKRLRLTNLDVQEAITEQEKTSFTKADFHQKNYKGTSCPRTQAHHKERAHYRSLR